MGNVFVMVCFSTHLSLSEKGSTLNENHLLPQMLSFQKEDKIVLAEISPRESVSILIL